MNWRSLWRILSMSCREASELASASLDRELTRGERIALRMHLLLCHPCRTLVTQLRMMRDLCSEMPAKWRDCWRDESATLSTERREQIKRLLTESGNSDSAS